MTVTPRELAVRMQTIDVVLAAIAARHKGLITSVAALAAGISQATLENRVRAGVLLRVHHGVYRHAAVPFTQDMRWLAAVLAGGDDALLCGRAAAALHGFPLIRRLRPEIVSPHTDLPVIAGVDVHRAVRIRPFERTVVRGIPVTSKGKTALDLCGHVSLEFAQEVIAQAVVTKILRPVELIATIERSAGRGIHGSAALRLIGASIDDLRDLESVLELDGARLLDRADVPAAARQYPFTCADGREVRFDLAWPDVKLAVDWDGQRWHATPARKRRTKARHEAIMASDWNEHLSFGWSDVHDLSSDVLREVEQRHRACAALGQKAA